MWSPAPPELPELDTMVTGLQGEEFGSLRIIGASTAYGYDYKGRPAVFVTVILPNPEGPAWDTEDGLELVQTVAERVRALADRRFYVKVKPQFPEPVEDDVEPVRAQRA